MNWRWLFFSFRGRINRAKYWLAMLVYLLLDLILWLVTAALAWLGVFQAELGYTQVFHAANTLFAFALWLSAVAVSTKRLHDRDKSGWWLLLVYVAPLAAILPGGLIGALNADLGGMTLRICVLAAFAFIAWFFVELGCLAGTRGYNRYGRDPLGTAQIETRSVRG